MIQSIDTKFEIGDKVRLQSGDSGQVSGISIEITSSRIVVFYTVRCTIGIGYTLAKKSEDELEACD